MVASRWVTSVFILLNMPALHVKKYTLKSEAVRKCIRIIASKSIIFGGKSLGLWSQIACLMTCVHKTKLTN